MKEMLKMQDYIKSSDRLKYYEDSVEPTAAVILAMIAAMLAAVVALWWLTFPENVARLVAFLGIA